MLSAVMTKLAVMVAARAGVSKWAAALGWFALAAFCTKVIGPLGVAPLGGMPSDTGTEK